MSATLPGASGARWAGLTAGGAGAGVGLVTAVRKSHVHGYLNSAGLSCWANFHPTSGRAFASAH